MPEFVKLLVMCNTCGGDVECYGPFATIEEAEDFNDYPENSYYGMTCISVKVVPMLETHK